MEHFSLWINPSLPSGHLGWNGEQQQAYLLEWGCVLWGSESTELGPGPEGEVTHQVGAGTEMWLVDARPGNGLSSCGTRSCRESFIHLHQPDLSDLSPAAEVGCGPKEQAAPCPREPQKAFHPLFTDGYDLSRCWEGVRQKTLFVVSSSASWSALGSLMSMTQYDRFESQLFYYLVR